MSATHLNLTDLIALTILAEQWNTSKYLYYKAQTNELTN
jgi:hypothetical protein